jgi:chemotaxis protein methyltransferase CheR
LDAAMRNPVTETEDLEIRLLLEAVFQKYQHDFRGYSHASIKRRLLQAKTRFGCRSLSELQHQLLHEPGVMARLLPYLTVQVSEMFRDPPYFKAIREHVVPHLKTYPSLKIWIAGCSTGEELYSLAIVFREEGLESRTIFYATDINSEALSCAGAAVYDLDRIALFSENYRLAGGKGSLSDYYFASYGRAKFDETLRKQTVFSNHSLVSDSVFAEMHMVSCRNVLIYFDRSLQDRAIGLFKEALVRRGFLGLGSKESIRFSAHTDAFEDFDREHRIYQKTGCT